MKYRSNYRKIYEQDFGSIPNDNNNIPFDIHHKDGDRTNNSIENLEALSVQDHYNRHYEQGDWGACFALANRITMSFEERSALSKLVQARNIERGVHNFLKRPDGNSVGRDTARRLAKEGNHLFQTERAKQWRADNAQKQAIRLKTNGWSKESITARVETRRKQNNYSTTMSACQTPEAIAKRVASRKANKIVREQAAVRSVLDSDNHQ